jgi:hypothetical protein
MNALAILQPSHERCPLAPSPAKSREERERGRSVASVVHGSE